MTKAQHHHGDLRNALIQAGLDLLETEGMHGLTLRKAAAKAGVSHAAPAHHFDGKDGLLIAIATKGFELFTQTMLEDRFVKGDSAQDQLLGICLGYLRFANEHPALLHLIFFTDKKNAREDMELNAAASHAYQVLSDVCSLFEPSPDGPHVNEMAVWSTIHGFATLTQFSQGPNVDEAVAFPLAAILPKLTPKS